MTNSVSTRSDILNVLNQSESLHKRLKEFDKHLQPLEHPMRSETFDALYQLVARRQSEWINASSTVSPVTLLAALEAAHGFLDDHPHQPPVSGQPSPIQPIKAPEGSLVFPEDPYVFIDYFAARDQVDTTFGEKVHTVVVGTQVMKVVIFEGSKVYGVFEEPAHREGNFNLHPKRMLICFDLGTREFILEQPALGPNGVEALITAMMLDIYPDQLLETVENKDQADLQATIIKNMTNLFAMADEFKIHTFPWSK